MFKSLMSSSIGSSATKLLAAKMMPPSVARVVSYLATSGTHQERAAIALGDISAARSKAASVLAELQNGRIERDALIRPILLDVINAYLKTMPEDLRPHIAELMQTANAVVPELGGDYPDESKFIEDAIVPAILKLLPEGSVPSRLDSQFL